MDDKNVKWQNVKWKGLTKNVQNLQHVLPGGRGDDKEKRGVEKRKQDSLHCAFALQDPCWHFNLISWKKELCFTRDLLNDAHLVCITLCFCPPGTLLAFQFYLSDGRLTDDGNIVITLKIARLRNALWRAILRRAILSMSFIRIARPIYFVFFCVDMPFK